MGLNLTEKDIENPDVLGEKLIQLAEIIIRKHYYASLKDKDDLISVGVLKALTAIEGNAWTKSRGSFATYIYSGMRNEMHNYLYHQNKFPNVDIDTMKEESIEDKYFNDVRCPIEYGLVHSVCINFTETFGDVIELRVVEKLRELGYSIMGAGVETISHMNSLMYCSSILEDNYGKDVEDDIVGRIIGLILWSKKEHKS